MAYSELIKNFEKIRAYMRDFYICIEARRKIRICPKIAFDR